MKKCHDTSQKIEFLGMEKDKKINIYINVFFTFIQDKIFHFKY
jgi:hypothetical protein